jgi:hypothetical protein
MKVLNPQVYAGTPTEVADAAETTLLSWRDFLLSPGGPDYVGVNSYDKQESGNDHKRKRHGKLNTGNAR